MTEILRRPEAEDAVTMHGRFVSAGYLPAVGLPLVAGRHFTTAEARRSPPAPVAILDASAARQVFGTVDVVGRQVLIAGARRFVPHEIVGVVGDSGWRDFREGPRPAVYQPAMSRLIIGTFHVRTARPIDETVTLVRDAFHAVEPDLPLDGLTTVEAELSGLAAADRLLTKVGLLLATIALAIAIAGTYAVVARGVGERTREFGVRAALGAGAADLSWGVVRGALAVGALGVAGGLGVYAWLSRFLESRLYGVSALDPATLVATGLGLLLTTLVAAWVPARRAARVDPTVALRAE